MKVLKADFFAMLALVAAGVGWGLHTAVAMGWMLGDKPSAGTVTLVVALLATLVCLPAAGIRIRRIQNLFQNGKMVTGVVTSVWLERDRGRVEFRFPGQDGQEVNAGHALHRSAAAEELQEGLAVDVIYDPANPGFALIVSLFH